MDLIIAFWDMRNVHPLIGVVTYGYLALTVYSTYCFVKEHIL